MEDWFYLLYLANHGLLLSWLYSNTAEEEHQENYVGKFNKMPSITHDWSHVSATRQTQCNIEQ